MNKAKQSALCNAQGGLLFIQLQFVDVRVGDEMEARGLQR